MIIWSGAGIFVLAIVLIVLVLTDLSLGALFHDPKFYAQHGWPKLLAFWMVAAILWPWGRWLHRNQPRFKELVDPETGERMKVYMPRPKELADPETGERIQVNMDSGSHTLFFIPVEYWGVIFAVLGIVMLFV